MLKHKYIKISLFILTLFAGLFLFHTKLASANLLATPASVKSVSFAWTDMSDIQATFKCEIPSAGAPCDPPVGPGTNNPTATYQVNFFDPNAITDFPYGNNEVFGNPGTANPAIECVYPGGAIEGNSDIAPYQFGGSISPNPTNPDTNAGVLWKYQWYQHSGSSYCAQSSPDGETPNTHIKISDPKESNGFLASNIFYKLNSNKTQIDRTDNSAGVVHYYQCSFDLNEYMQGGCNTGACNNILVVESDQSVYLWPLTSQSSDPNIPYTFKAEPKTTETQQLGVLGCYFLTPAQAAGEDNNGDNTSGNDGPGQIVLANKISQNQNSSTGQILVGVNGLAYIKNNNGSGPPTGTVTSPEGGTNTATTCDNSGGDLAWVICSVTRGIMSAEETIESNVIDPLLQTITLNFNASASCASGSSSCSNADKISATTYNIWSNFRLYANVLLVIGLLIVVYAETIGGGVGEAYAAKKILPRLLIAAILINLSIYIVAGLEDIFNVLGVGLLTIIEKPFLAAHIHSLVVSQGAGRLAFGLGLGTVAVIGFTQGIAGIFLFVMGTALIGALGVLITLVIRQGLLFFLILTSPIAFVLYLLPNTEQYFRRWINLLIRTLVVYPVVTIVFAMSYITATIVSNFGIHPVIIAQLIAVLAEVVPLFLIPFAFRISGGVIASVQGQVSNLAKTARQPFDSLRKANQADRLQRARTGNLWRGESRLSKAVSRNAQRVMLANRAGLKPWKMRENLRTAMATQTFDAASEFLEKNQTMSHIKNDDDKMWALMRGGTEEDMAETLKKAAPGRFAGTANEGSLREALSELNRVRKEGGDRVVKVAATRAQAGTGTGFSDSADMLESINTAAGADRSLANTMLGEMRGAAMQSGRVDLGASGFAVTAATMQGLYDKSVSHQDANARIMESVIDSSGAAQALYGKPQSAAALAEAHATRIDNNLKKMEEEEQAFYLATAAGAPEAEIQARSNRYEAAQRDLDQSLASAMGVYDAMGQATPQNARAFADGLIGHTITDPKNPAQKFDLFNFAQQRMSTSPEFTRMRRDYGSGMTAQALQNAGIRPGTAAPPAPPTAGPPQT